MEKIAKKTKFKDLKKNQVPLTPEERAEVMKRKAVWHYNGGSPSPAVWKSVDKKTGEVTYVTHTHRAFNTAPTVKGAIGRFHSFIKSTASENVDARIEKTALNAQKAREMAKGLGLVTDGDWRWALRNLRNMKTGDVLKGRELAEAKRKMGAMSNNAWQKVKSKTRGLASKTEIGGRYDKKTGRVSDITVGAPRAHNVDGANELDNFHTHPGNGGENKWTFVHQMKNQT
jgi:hypothetical protein